MGTPLTPRKKEAEPTSNFWPMFIVAKSWMDQDGTRHGRGPQHRRLWVRWGPSPLCKKGRSPLPNFRPNGWIHQDATWHGCRPQPRELCVRWGPSSPPQKGDRAPKFSAHVYCGQTAGWIKMAVGTEVGLSPGDFVLNGDPASSPKTGWRPPIFGPCLLRPNGCMDQDATWYRGRL